MNNNEVQANCRRLMQMVGHLHRIGYQRLRLNPGIAPSGFFWRCHVRPVNTEGVYLVRIEELDLEAEASYSSSEKTEFFGWPDAANDTPEQLAAKFVERFPIRAALGFGADEEYAAWYADMMEKTAPAGLIFDYADYDLPPDRVSVINVKEGTFISKPPTGRP
jgi:hypothetical protein